MLYIMWLKILIIPNTLTLSDILDKFNEARENFAVILNEYAHVVGLIILSIGLLGFNAFKYFNYTFKSNKRVVLINMILLIQY